MFASSTSSRLQIHPQALGYSKCAASPFVSSFGARLVITTVLTDKGMERVRDLPRQPGPGRPRVYCPFCGLQGRYKVPQLDPDAFTPHFAHEGGNDQCSEGALESIRHRRAKAALLAGLERLRKAKAPLRGTVRCRRCKEPFVRTLLEGWEWSSEHEELAVAGSARRPDVSAVYKTRPVFFFEVHVTHRVDAEKSHLYAAESVAGIELDAASVLDEKNQPRWNGDEALDAPIASWHLERAPRQFSICPECRSGTEELRLISYLVGKLERESPTKASEFLHRAAVAFELSSQKVRDLGSQALFQAIEAPERLRTKWGEVIGETLADKNRWTSARTVLLSGLDLERDYWGDAPMAALLNNPYDALIQSALEGREVEEEALRAADLIARVQRRPLTQDRFCAYAGRTLVRRQRTGHTAVTPDALLSEVSRAARVSRAEATPWLHEATRSGEVLVSALGPSESNGRVGLVTIGRREAQIAAAVRRRRYPGTRKTEVPQIGNLSREQRAAVQTALDHGMSVITGGPGTGKTSVISGILQVSKQLHPQRCWYLAAPTNKAMQRLQQVTGLADTQLARTVHSWIGRKAALQEDPPYGLIVDEAGFLDLELMAELLEATQRVRRLVLVGDPNQLPSIGMGAVLRDLKNSGVLAHAELRQNHRTQDGSGLVEAASAILAGRIPPESPGMRCVRPRSDGSDLEEVLLREYARLVEESEKGSQDVQVLAPTRKLVAALNKRIQAQYNRNGETIRFAPHLRTGDRVVCTETVYDFGLKNGVVGALKSASANALLVQFENAESVTLVHQDHASAIAPAYAMTVHKTQGSEWPSVLIGLDAQSSFIDRSLLYTAATRAKRSLVVVAATSHLRHAVQNLRERETQLGQYMLGPKRHPVRRDG